jgi:hypothetical protein
MALSDYKNLQWLREGSDADWKKALEEQRLISMGKEALKSSAYTPTERMITNPLSSGLEFLNVDPRFARRTSENFANVAGFTPTGIPLSGAEGGDIFGRSVAKNNPLGMAGGLGIGVAGMMVGKGSKTWDAVREAETQKMLSEGLDPSSVWNKTLTGKGLDNMLRQEISDQNAKFLRDPVFMPRTNQMSIEEYRALGEIHPNKTLSELDKIAGRTNPNYNVPLSSLLDHPELYKAYPQLKDLPINFEPNLRSRGSFIPPREYSKMNPEGYVELKTPQVVRPNLPYTLDAKRKEDILSTLLHEVQHKIQDVEGFAKGGAPSEFKDQTKDFDKYHQARFLRRMMENDSISAKEAANQWEAQLYTRPKAGAITLAKNNDREALDKLMSNLMTKQDQYVRLGGEMEARLAQRRKELDMINRGKHYPFKKYNSQDYNFGDLASKFGFDVPPEEALLKYDYNRYKYPKK